MYRVIAVWMPVTVVSRSFATVAIDTFITDESRIITNCAAASVTSTALAAAPSRADVAVASVIPAPLRGRACQPRAGSTSSAYRRSELQPSSMGMPPTNGWRLHVAAGPFPASRSTSSAGVTTS